MAKSPDIAELTATPLVCPPPPDGKSRRWRQECEVRIVAQRRQAAERTSECEVPLGEVLHAPVAEPVIESAQPLPVVPIGQSGAQPPEKSESSLRLMFRAVFSMGSDDILGGAATAPDETIIGSGDRAHHLALVSGTGPLPPPLRQPQRAPLLTPPAPKSRADCRRRCGRDGFCDPSSALGCGGVHCGNPVLRETL